MPDPADERERLRAALPPAHGHRSRRGRLVGGALDRLLDARQQAMGIGRELDRAAEEMPVRRVLALGIYGPDRAEQMEAAVERVGRTRHQLRLVLGALDEAAPPGLEQVTELTGLSAGKFANLNRLAERAAPLAFDWVLLLDDDVGLTRHFLDRMVCACERLRFDLAQPALSRASHGVWDVNRRRPDLARQVRLVEIGPAVLMRQGVWRRLHPFPEPGMGWGMCLHWAALAERQGWRLGVIDAVPVRHEARPPAASYEREAAVAAAVDFLAAHEHIDHRRAEQVLATHAGLP